MVSYCNSLAMYRHQQQPHPAPGWYQSYQPQVHPQVPQQYLSCVQDAHAAAHHQHQQTIPSWHHPAHPPPPHHPVFQPGDWSPSSTPDYMHHHHQSLHEHADALLPSPPMTVSGSDMSSPSGGTGGTVTPPQSSGPGPGTPLGTPLGTPRPVPARSPFEWMKKPSYTSQPNPGKTRTKDKYRVVYSDHQRLELEKEFHYSRYITIRRKAELAASLGLSERQVKIWFQNRRAKERKQTKKREELDHKVKPEDLQPQGHQGHQGHPPHLGGHGHSLAHVHHHALHHQLHHQMHHGHHSGSNPGSTSPLSLPLSHSGPGGSLGGGPLGGGSLGGGPLGGGHGGHSGGHLVHHHMLASAGSASQHTSSGGGGGGGGSGSSSSSGGGSSASGPLSTSASNNSSGSTGSASGAAANVSSGGGSGSIM
ncbi:homeobox protein abdominal-A homolog isoform X2 [Frankliniella occidentalis]|uniref:Homeobox protein abdominal-A homolog isoform X2 n=1 Tax=Frankliniella occidentalis TaxID=133901 RepID=A0A6J1S7B7_FRAOC|nr:homeobox protein abdominal-A homolog isoform X2 [Frankliniella occidentalis]